MLPKHLFSTVVVAAVVTSSSVTFAQFYGGGGCSSCGPVAAPPVSCTPIQPLQATCYQTVPVTTYQRERQTVQVPVYKTAWEERDVTEYVPVTTQRTVEVPTVRYQTVVENRTVNRDMGRWQTNYHPIKKCAPCQVDPRPGMIGWLNRTGYSFRSSFVPNYRTTRQYVPRMVTCNVPYTRQVAIRGTKKVVVNDTKMVAQTRKQRVKVSKVSYEDKVVTVMRPSVAYRTVPIGPTTTAFGYGYGGSSIAYGGFGYGSEIAFVDDEATQSAQRPVEDPTFNDDPTRTARPFEDDLDREPGERTFQRTENDNDGRFQRTSREEILPPAGANQLKSPPTAFPTNEPSPRPEFSTFGPQTKRDSRTSPASYSRAPSRRTASRGWKASRSSTASQTASKDSIRPSQSSVANRD